MKREKRPRAVPAGAARMFIQLPRMLMAAAGVCTGTALLVLSGPAAMAGVTIESASRTLHVAAGPPVSLTDLAATRGLGVWERELYIEEIAPPWTPDAEKSWGWARQSSDVGEQSGVVYMRGAGAAGGQDGVPGDEGRGIGAMSYQLNFTIEAPITAYLRLEAAGSDAFTEQRFAQLDGPGGMVFRETGAGGALYVLSEAGSYTFTAMFADGWDGAGSGYGEGSFAFAFSVPGPGGLVVLAGLGRRRRRGVSLPLPLVKRTPVGSRPRLSVAER